MTTNSVFLLHWNGTGPKGCEVLRFVDRASAHAYSYDSLPGDRIAHVVAEVNDLNDRLLFNGKVMVDIFNAITKNNPGVAKFESLQYGRDRIFRVLTDRFGDLPITLPKETEDMATRYIVTMTEDATSILTVNSAAKAKEAIDGAPSGADAYEVQNPEHLEGFTVSQLLAIYNSASPTPKSAFREGKADAIARTMEALSNMGKPAPAAKAPRAPRTPRVEGAPRTLDKPAAAIGKPVRAGSKNAFMVKALLAGSTLDQMAGENTYPRDAIQARLWGLWSSSGIGYKVKDGVYTIELPTNLTADTVIKTPAEEVKRAA